MARTGSGGLPGDPSCSAAYWSYAMKEHANVSGEKTVQSLQSSAWCEGHAMKEHANFSGGKTVQSLQSGAWCEGQGPQLHPAEDGRVQPSTAEHVTPRAQGGRQGCGLGVCVCVLRFSCVGDSCAVREASVVHF